MSSRDPFRHPSSKVGRIRTGAIHTMKSTGTQKVPIGYSNLHWSIAHYEYIFLLVLSNYVDRRRYCISHASSSDCVNLGSALLAVSMGADLEMMVLRNFVFQQAVINDHT